MRFRKKTNIPVPAVRLVPREHDAAPWPAKRRSIRDAYAQLLAASWGQLLCLIFAVYVLANLIFASAYFFLGDGIENARPGSFIDAFFFSVQTLATIGYGKMSPIGLVANLLVTLEAISGFIFFAMVTGLIFSKFSRPTARLIFSKIALITSYDGAQHFMFRIANERNNRIVDANIQIAVLRKEKTTEGIEMRRFYDLLPTRQRVPLLQLTWTVMHKLDEHSPLFGMSNEMLEQEEVEIIVTLTGLDETFSQVIHARYSYIPKEIRYDCVFEDIIHRSKDGKIRIAHHLFHEVKKRQTATSS